MRKLLMLVVLSLSGLVYGGEITDAQKRAHAGFKRRLGWNFALLKDQKSGCCGLSGRLNSFIYGRQEFRNFYNIRYVNHVNGVIAYRSYFFPYELTSMRRLATEAGQLNFVIPDDVINDQDDLRALRSLVTLAGGMLEVD